MNLLVNPGFEGGLQPRELPDGSKPQHLAYVSEVQVTGGAITQRYTVERGEIRNPLGWFAWYAHQRSESPVPWDPPNQVGWAEPETRLSETEHQRHRSGERAFYLFTYGRIHEAGLFQQVRVTPGDLLRFTAFGHAWSAHDQPTPKPPHCSNAGCGPLAWKAGTPGLNDDQKAHTLWVGIDPTGGIDPYASSVIWGDGWHIYNNYRNEPLAVEAVAQNEVVTVFLRSSCLWRFTHNDVAWDDATLVVPGAPGPVIPPPPVGGEQPYIARGTKVGYHCIAPRQVPGHVAQLAQQGAPVPVVKAVDDWGALVEIKRVSPQTITVARKTFGYDIELAAGLAGMTPAQIKAHAQYLMGLLREKCLEEVQRGGMERLAAIDYLSTPICEADPKTADGSGYRNLALLMLEMLDIAERWDLPCKRLALFELNAGTPEWWDYVAMLETGVFERMQAGGHVLALHEGTLAVDGYTWEDAPIDLWWGPGHTIPGAPDVLGSGSLCFRYRYLLHLLRQRGLYVPIVISEFYAGGGYAGADPAAILARMRWYDELAAQDPELLAFTPYTFGGAGVGWDEQDYDFLLDSLAAYALEIKSRQNAVPEGETPPPAPGGLDHVVTIHLLPQDTVLVELLAVAQLLHPDRTSFTSSADDAAYLAASGLPGSKVVVWEAARWRDGDIAAYLRNKGVGNIEHRRFGASSPEPEPPVVKPLLVTPFSQRNPTWANDRMLPSARTVGGSGCAMVSACMLATMVESALTPGDLNARLGAVGGYTPDGLLYWRKVADVVSGMTFKTYTTWRSNPKPPADMARVWAALSRGPAVIQVDLKPGTTALDTHFVLALRREGDDDIAIVDPLDGVQTTLKFRYWRGSLEASIYALAEYEIAGAPPPVTPPSGSALRGVHGAPTYNPPDNINGWIARLQALGIRWYKLLDAGHPRNLDFIAALRVAGIEPIVRLYQGQQFPGRLNPDLRARFPALAAAGARLVEIGNEPNLAVEWSHGVQPDYQNSDHVAQVAAAWWADAQEALNAGLCPALYALAPTERNYGVHPTASSVNWQSRLLLALQRRAGTQTIADLLRSGRVWLAVHTADFGLPFDHPAIDVHGRRDDMCLTGYRIHVDLVYNVFGVRPLTISTEGGVYSPEHLGDLTFPVTYTEEAWGTRLAAMYEFLAQRGDLLAMCPWTFSDEGAPGEWHNCGWYRADGTARSPVAALRS